MIRKITLENYMSHQLTVIEPAAGLTVLIGPNNCGKSAIMHALEMICYNPSGTDYAIRHGTKKATVTVDVQDDEGKTHTIVWWRKKKTAGYIIDGREISGVSELPADLHKYLRMPMVESAGGEKFPLHFGMQKSPIFLLDDDNAKGRAAQFFASATDADKLVQMQQAHRQKVLVATREKKKIDAELAHLDGQLGTLEPLTELSERLGRLEDSHAAAMKLGQDVGQLQQALGRLEIAWLNSSRLAAEAGHLATLRPVPTLIDTTPMAQWIGDAERCIRAVDRTRAEGAVLGALAEPPALLPTEPLRQGCEELAEAIQRRRRNQHVAEALSPLAAPPALPDVAALASAVEQIGKYQSAAALSHAASAALAALATPPELAQTERIEHLVKALQAADVHQRQCRVRANAVAELPAVPALDDTGELGEAIGGLANAMGVTSRPLGGLAADGIY